VRFGYTLEFGFNSRFVNLTVRKMWRKWFNETFKPLNKRYMSKEKDHIELFATEDGKLYIKPSDLFERKNVQKIIEKMASSPILRPTKLKPGRH